MVTHKQGFKKDKAATKEKNENILIFKESGVKAGREYKGEITRYQITEDGKFRLWLRLAANADVEYLWTRRKELHIGSPLFQLFQNLKLLDNKNRVDLSLIEGRKILAVLKRVGEGTMLVDTMKLDSSTYMEENETEDIEDEYEAEDDEYE